MYNFYGDCLFSDETADDLNSRAGALHRRAGQLRSSVGRGDSQEITYVPTSVLKGHNQTMELSRAPNGTEVRNCTAIHLKSYFNESLRLCINKKRDLAVVVATSFVKE